MLVVRHLYALQEMLWIFAWDALSVCELFCELLVWKVLLYFLYTTDMLLAMMMHWFRCHDLLLIYVFVVKMQVSMLLFLKCI